jgi:succinate-acetate transporter protein
MTTAAEPLAAARAPMAEAAIADPAPLGLGAFALTVMVLSVVNAGIVPVTLLPTVLGLALFYGGAGLLLAGMWEFRRGNTFGAVAFSSYGMFWLSYWFYASFVAARLPIGQIHQATGLFLLGWTIFTAYMTVASLRTNGAVAATFILLTLTFLFLTIGAFGSTVPSTSSMTKIGGWLGLVTALAAWYTSFAGVANATFKRTVLPTWPMAATAERG